MGLSDLSCNGFVVDFGREGVAKSISGFSLVVVGPGKFNLSVLAPPVPARSMPLSFDEGDPVSDGFVLNLPVVVGEPDFEGVGGVYVFAVVVVEVVVVALGGVDDFAAVAEVGFVIVVEVVVVVAGGGGDDFAAEVGEGFVVVVEDNEG